MARVGVQGALPLLGVLPVFPACLVRFDVLLGAIGKRDGAGLLPLFLGSVTLACREKVLTVSKLPAHVRGLSVVLTWR